MAADRATRHVDVVIVGAGLAGLSLARQIHLAAPSLTILHLEKRRQIPPPQQKVGEATVQVSGYYFSKVLELEEHLLREHFLKYNLRFYWKSAGRDNTRFDDYSQSFIRGLSNVASYQLDRNTLEVELRRRNESSANYTLVLGAAGVTVEIDPESGHRVDFDTAAGRETVRAHWVVDASGRGHLLSRRRGLERPSAIRHGASFFWVDGLLNVEALTDWSPRQIRLNPARASLGHLPFWLATNHFCGEGFWLWVIPLQGKTSLGLVYDTSRVAPTEVDTPDKLVAWVCREFPLFARDLPTRTVLSHGSFRDAAFDCVQTIDQARWALVGDAGRFSDPLYSPGGDLIAIYNTLVTDAIVATAPADLPAKAALYEQLMRAVYGAYVPSYSVSYAALGDQEAMTLKYVWELTVYFGFYVFPFINDLFTDRRFAVSFLRQFTHLGRVNAGVQALVAGYYQWKQRACEPRREPVLADFFEHGALAVAEQSFYQVGVTVDQAREVLDTQYANLRDLARFIAAHVYSVVLDDERLMHDRRFVEAIDVERLTFDLDAIQRARPAAVAADDPYVWPWHPQAMRRLAPSLRSVEPEAPPRALADEAGR